MVIKDATNEIRYVTGTVIVSEYEEMLMIVDLEYNNYAVLSLDEGTYVKNSEGDTLVFKGEPKYDEVQFAVGSSIAVFDPTDLKVTSTEDNLKTGDTSMTFNTGDIVKLVAGESYYLVTEYVSDNEVRHVLVAISGADTGRIRPHLLRANETHTVEEYAPKDTINYSIPGVWE